MADKSMRFTLDFLAKTAGLKNAAELLEEIGDEFDNTGDEAKAVTRAVSMMAERTERDLADVKAIAERLGNALGADLRASIGQVPINDFAANLKRAGMTLEQVDANVDELASSLGRIKTAQASVQFSKPIDDYGQSMERARDVQASFVGNALTELPMIGGAFGPANEAISQMTERLMLGESRFRDLLSVAGPMAAVGVGIALVNKSLERQAKIDAFKKERVEAFADALREGATAAEAWDAALKASEERKVEFMHGGTAGLQDLTDELYRAGVTWGEFQSKLTLSEDAFRSWASSVFASKDGANDLNMALNAYWDMTEAATEATERVSMEQFVFGDALKDTADRAAKAKRATEALNDALDEQADAYERAYDGARRYEGAALDVTEAQLDLAEAQAEANEVLNDANSTEADRQRALIDLRRAQMNLNDSVIAQADAYARSTGAQEGSRAYAAAQKAELERLKAVFPELTAEIDAYIRTLGRIPSTVTMNVVTNVGGQAYTGGGNTGDVALIHPGVGGSRLQSIDPGAGVGQGRRGGAGGGLSVTVNVTPGMADTPTAYGQAVADALTRWWNDGGRAAWMGSA